MDYGASPAIWDHTYYPTQVNVPHFNPSQTVLGSQCTKFYPNSFRFDIFIVRRPRSYFFQTQCSCSGMCLNDGLVSAWLRTRSRACSVWSRQQLTGCSRRPLVPSRSLDSCRTLAISGLPTAPHASSPTTRSGQNSPRVKEILLVAAIFYLFFFLIVCTAFMPQFLCISHLHRLLVFARVNSAWPSLVLSVSAMSTGESWDDVNGHTVQCTSSVFVVTSRCKLVSGWGLTKWRSVPLYGPKGAERTTFLLLCFLTAEDSRTEWRRKTAERVTCVSGWLLHGVS